MHAIPTDYAGLHFRSRLEATWACFFDLLGLKWEYEPFDLKGYIPDFSVVFNDELLVWEIKPNVGWQTEIAVLQSYVLKIDRSGWEGRAFVSSEPTIVLERHVSGPLAPGWSAGFPFPHGPIPWDLDEKIKSLWHKAKNKTQWSKPLESVEKVHDPPRIEGRRYDEAGRGYVLTHGLPVELGPVAGVMLLSPSSDCRARAFALVMRAIQKKLETATMTELELLLREKNRLLRQRASA